MSRMDRSKKDNGMKQDYHDKNRAPKERAALLLAELSLEEKMAQLSCIFPFGEAC